MDNTINSLAKNFVSNSGNSSGLTDYQGKSYDPNTILALSRQVAASIDPNAIKGGVFNTKGQSVGFNYDQATNLLGHPPTAAEQVILDMSRYLANEGVTDLNQVNATDTNRRFGSTYTGGGGTIYEIKKDANGKPVISSWSKDTSDTKNILTGLALAGMAFGIPGLTEGLLSSAPAGATLGTVGAEGAAALEGGSTLGSLGGADLYADVAGAAGGGGGTALSNIAAGGGADLYADLANPLSGANTLGTAGAAGAGGLSALDAGMNTYGPSANLTNVGANTLGAGAGGLASSILGNAAGATTGDALSSYFTGGAGTGALTAGVGAGLGGLLSGLGDSLTGGGLGTALGLSSLGSLASGVLGANAATTAADKQSAAATYAADLQKKMFDTLNQQQAPYRAGGYSALNQIGSMMGGDYTKYDANGNPIGTGTGNDYFTHQFNAQDFQNNIDPGYAWRLQQGQMANQRLANKAGGLLGANAQQGMQDYTQGLASQEYQNAFNRYTGNQTNIYNRLASLAGIGQAGQNQTNQAAQSAATNMGNLAVGSAGAQAAGGVGAANAYGNALGGIGNNLMLSQLLNQKQNIGP